MCVVSNVFDYHRDRWKPEPYTAPPPVTWPWGERSPGGQAPPSPSEIEEFRRLLEKARKWDAENNEPDCESEWKKDALKALADHWGIEIEVDLD